MNIGIDITSISKFRKIKKSDYKSWKKIFTKKEWNYAFASNKAARYLAGAFAAKEACMKAYGKVGAKNFLNFEISRGKSGAPKVNKKNCRLSLSYDQNMAVAVILVV